MLGRGTVHRFRTTLIAALLVASCATPRNGVPATLRPFTAELGRAFDDSADFIEDVDAIGGRVASDWNRQISTLAAESDLIVSVRVETLTLGGDHDTARAYRLTAAASRDPILGTLPNDRRVDLRVTEGEGGFNGVAQNEQRLQTRPYVLFVRWYNDEGTPRAHWHLSPETTALVGRVREASGALDPNAPREEVIRQ